MKSRRQRARSTDYVRDLTLRAPIERAFDAIATVEGLRGWWTRLVTGTERQGGEIRLAFDGMDEHIDMRVVAFRRPVEVQWAILHHTSLEEWAGTTVHFTLSPVDENTCNLAFRHEGLSPKLACYEDCEAGWEHFLASLTSLAEQGQGEPFDASWRNA